MTSRIVASVVLLTSLSALAVRAQTASDNRVAGNCNAVGSNNRVTCNDVDTIRKALEPEHRELLDKLLPNQDLQRQFSFEAFARRAEASHAQATQQLSRQIARNGALLERRLGEMLQSRIEDLLETLLAAKEAAPARDLLEHGNVDAAEQALHTVRVANNVDCNASNKTPLEAALCRLGEAQVNQDDPNRRAELYCEALLLVASPPVQGEGACAAAIALHYLKRDAEAREVYSRCTPEHDETRAWTRPLAKPDPNAGYPFSITFPPAALRTLMVSDNHGKRRIAYCSSVPAAQRARQNDDVDSKGIKLSLERGSSTIEAEWRDGLPPYTTTLSFDNYHDGAETRSFGVISVTLNVAAKASVTARADGVSYPLKRISSDEKSPGAYSATVPAYRKYELVVSAQGFETRREEIEVGTLEPSAVPFELIAAGSGGRLDPHSTSPIVKRNPVWLVVGAGGLLAVVAGFVTYAVAAGQTARLEEQCTTATPCDDIAERRKPIDTLDTVSNVLWIAGGVTAAGAAAAFLLLPIRETQTLTFQTGPGALRITNSWRF